MFKLLVVKFCQWDEFEAKAYGKVLLNHCSDQSFMIVSAYMGILITRTLYDIIIYRTCENQNY